MGSKGSVLILEVIDFKALSDLCPHTIIDFHEASKILGNLEQYYQPSYSTGVGWMTPTRKPAWLGNSFVVSNTVAWCSTNPVPNSPAMLLDWLLRNLLFLAQKTNYSCKITRPFSGIMWQSQAEYFLQTNCIFDIQA